jgi:hypothetical protein
MRPRSTSKPTRKIQSSLPVTMATGTSANAQLATQGLLFSPNIFLYQSPKTSHKNSTPSKVELSPLNSKSFTSSPPTFPTQARNLIGCSTGSQTTTSASKLIATNSKPRRQSFYPDTVKYSWWSMRTGGRAKNIGWRLDYFLVDSKSI